MDSDYIWPLVIVGGVLLLFIAIGVGVSFDEAHQSRVMLELVSKGASPMEAACATRIAP